MVSYLMNAMKNFDKTDGEYSLVLTDDLFSFWRSKVQAMNVAEAPTSMLGRHSLSSSLFLLTYGPHRL